MKKRLVGTIDGDGGEWVLWQISENNDWLGLKLDAPYRAKKPGQKKLKRSYWTGWNGERLARSRDTGILAEFDPDMLKALEALCRESLQK
jgi:hypothetical protein